MTTAVKGMEKFHTLSPETALVAQYLESERIYSDTEYFVQIWEGTGMPLSVLAETLRRLFHGVMEESDRHINLDRVDWHFLAERYAEMFSRD